MNSLTSMIQSRQEDLLADLAIHREQWKREAAARVLTKARDFVATDYMGEWLDVGDRPGTAIDVPMLKELGRIEVMELNGRTFAREATA